MAANPAIDIPNLLYLYAELIDGARFDEAAALFDHARIVASGHEIRGRDAIAGMWSQWIKLYDCGTPRTRHIITNPIITLAEDGQSATCRSQWTVLQSAPGFPLQVVATGRYHDTVCADRRSLGLHRTRLCAHRSGRGFQCAHAHAFD